MKRSLSYGIAAASLAVAFSAGTLAHSAATHRTPVPYVTLQPGDVEPDCGVIVVWAGTLNEDDRGHCK